MLDSFPWDYPTLRVAARGARVVHSFDHEILPATRLSSQLTRMHSMKRILLVEDSMQDAELVIEALGECKLTNTVVHLRDGAEALDYLHRRGPYSERETGLPAVVMLDLKMPKVDGLEVLQSMKSDPVLKVVPVVIMTSSREERDLHESYRFGVNAYVVKPVQFHEFVEAIRRLGLFWAILNEPPFECR